MLHNRSASILSYLLDQEKPITISILSNHFGVSERTIRKDLKDIGDWLQDHELPVLRVKPRVGVYFENLTPEKRGIIKESLGSVNTYSYILSPDERTALLTIILLCLSKPITIGELADRLSVSKSTIANDLDSVSRWLQEHCLTLERKPHVGVYVVGDERDYRIAVLDLISQSEGLTRRLNRSHLRDKEQSSLRGGFQVYLKELFEDLDIASIETCLQDLQDDIGIEFNDDSRVRLLLHIATALRRLTMGYDITMPPSELSQLQSTIEFQHASKFCKKLESMLGVEIPPDEIGYITVHLLGARIYDSPLSQQYLDSKGLSLNYTTMSLASKIISKTEEMLGIKLSEDVDPLYYLALHLKPMLYRLRFRLPPIRNPILEDIRKTYPELFDLTRRILQDVLADWIDVEIADDEIGYITMHLGAALYRAQNSERQNRKIRILVVCSTGVGAAKLLASRLMSEFNNVTIVGTFSYHQIRKQSDLSNVDLIVSTVPLDELNLRYILVNPLLPESDIDRIRVSLNFKGHNLDVSSTTKLVLDLVDNYTDISDMNKIQLQKDLIALLTKPEIPIELIATVKSLPLTDLLTPSTIQVNQVAKDWKHAIRLASEPLLQLGVIEEQYVDAMIRAVERHGPFIVFTKGIAMPHANPQDGVNSVCMSLLTLKVPVCFGKPNLDPVDVIIVLGPLDNDSHLKALSQLVHILKDKNSVSKIRTASTVKEIMDILSSQLF